ncbi:Rho GTPase-activating protein 6 [Mytilus galloprovincialis]|uniref:Rho GTPase-activating protein 6 n=1 Tax=Mytilus galloprovincialis TaxID=29158 RepID=A0A8B6DDA3_MYTGA|nr:Rho GTPase-activating protein 6 [Mytilus galloprovincialis]
MTVHGQQEKPYTHQNGFVSKMVYPDSETMMNRSWNGYMFHVSPLSLPNGNIATPQKAHGPPKFSNEMRANFSMSYDGDESSQFDSLDSETEYVTLDNNYFLRTFSPPSRHLSILDFKRNELNDNKTNSLTRQSHSQSLISVKSPLKDRKWQKKSLRKLATNIGAVLSLSPRGGESLRRFPEEYVPVKRERSKSVGDIVENAKYEKEDSIELCLSDDDDNDDFGFINYPKCSSSLSLAMNKTKSPSSTHKILPKRFRSKTRPVPVVNTTLWSPEGNCCWCNVSGRKVVLKPSSLLQLTNAERLALQKIVLSKLQALDLGCSITIPKESPDTKRKRKVLAFKKSHSANLGALIDKIHDTKDKENKDSQPVGLVFGIPLAKCIANDNELRKRRAATKEKANDGDIVITRRDQRKSSSSSHGSLDNYTQNGGSTLSPDKLTRCAASSDSLSESDCSRHTTNSSLVDALSLSTSSRQGSLLTDTLPNVSSDSPQVPHIVNCCFKHIETYGLRVLGIFRVGASKKRVKQIRDEFDSGKDVHLDDSHSPHDVGALLKVYFRDLPDPLLTRDLYTPFVATRKLSSRENQSAAMQYLVALLPTSSRDTLQSLLNFLAKVVQHSTDTLEADGETLPGNKMDAHNLATLFGPNILRKTKGSEKEFNVESVERLEESKEVIEVVKDMIENYDKMFEVPAILRDEVLRLLLETDPDTADHLLKSFGSDVSIEPDPDTTSSSIYDDSDTASIPRSPCSEAELNPQRQYDHTPLRNSKSEEVMTPRTRRRFFFLSGNDNKTEKNDNNNTEKERPQFRLDRSPSPQPLRTPRSARPPKVKITKETSSPAVVRRHRSNITDRPQSENLSNCLAIPKPQYSRQLSTSAINSQTNTSADENPVSGEGGQWMQPSSPSTPSTAGSTPRTPRAFSSRHRPLGLGGIPRMPRTPFANSDWERERWRQWELLAKENVDEKYEKETLV